LEIVFTGWIQTRPRPFTEGFLRLKALMKELFDTTAEKV